MGPTALSAAVGFTHLRFTEGAQPVIEYDLADFHFSTPGGNGVLFRYRVGTNDYSTLLSCLNEDEYGLAGHRPTNALDIGSHLGGVAIGLAVDNPTCRVTAIEPVPDNIELIRFAAEANGVSDRVTVIAGAVGDGTETDVRYRFRGSESAEHHAFIGNALVAYNGAAESRAHESVTYTTLTITDVLALAGPVDFVKIDTEGGEWPFLGSPGLHELPLIVGEWHPVAGHTRAEFAVLLGNTHDVIFTGPEGGPGGFRAIRR